MLKAFLVSDDAVLDSNATCGGKRKVFFFPLFQSSSSNGSFSCKVSASAAVRSTAEMNERPLLAHTIILFRIYLMDSEGDSSSRAQYRVHTSNIL